jgi:hypothetical protein
MPEQLYEDFQKQAFEDSDLFLSGQQGKCPLSPFHLNRYSCLLHRI